MGIYIKNISMPKNCYECKFLRHGIKENWCYITYNGIPCECPLIDISVFHGRLIDVDALLDKLGSSDEDIYVETVLKKEAPIIIGAEGD